MLLLEYTNGHKLEKHATCISVVFWFVPKASFLFSSESEELGELFGLRRHGWIAY